MVMKSELIDEVAHLIQYGNEMYRTAPDEYAPYPAVIPTLDRVCEILREAGIEILSTETTKTGWKIFIPRQTDRTAVWNALQAQQIDINNLSLVVNMGQERWVQYDKS